MKHAKTITLYLTTVLAICAVVGCEAITGILLPNNTTISLVNNSDFPVDVELFYGDDQNALESVLEEFGTRVTRTVGAGEIARIVEDCDDLQAVFINDADLRVISGVGPETNTDVLRDGDDFGCGDVITFTFDHSAVIVDFDVSISVSD